jgi:hypothetical protein
MGVQKFANIRPKLVKFVRVATPVATPNDRSIGSTALVTSNREARTALRVLQTAIARLCVVAGANPSAPIGRGEFGPE